MASSFTVRLQRFPYLVIGWALLAGLSLVVPDRLFLTQRQGLWLGLAFLGVALTRGARQLGRELPHEIGTLELSHLPHRKEMQYVGHGFSWDSQHANEVIASERESKPLVGWKRKPGDAGGVATIHAVGGREEAPVFLPLSDLEGHMLVSGATRTGKTHYLQLDLVQAIERGTEAVIFIDPKGDLSVLHRAYDAAVRTGRQKDFQFFSLAFPHVSCTYNPLHNFVLGMEMPDRLSGLCSLAEGSRSRSRRSPGRSSTSSLRRCCLPENARCYRRSRATRRSTAAWKNCFRKFPSTPRNTNICRDSSSIRLTTTTRWSLPLSPCCRSWTRPISGI